MKDIFITTTNNIENATIDKYLGVISTNKVLGTNFFSDLDASITDIFGGNSDTYQRKLDIIYRQAIDSLSEKARACNANGIVGLHIDFDEISGKGKSMFMVSAIGTAVVMSIIKDKKVYSNKYISNEDLNDDVQKRELITKVNEGGLPNSKDWAFLKDNFIPEVAKKLFVTYIKKSYPENSLIEDNYPSFFKKLDKKEAEELMYQNLSDYYFHTVYDLAKLANVFSYRAIIDNIKSQKFEIATKLLEIDKGTYIPDDIESFSEIISLFDNLPDTGHYEVVKGMFSKPEEKYICPNGHKNPKNSIFCQNFDCGENIKGLTLKQMQRIDVFRIKLESLKDFFNKTED